MRSRLILTNRNAYLVLKALNLVAITAYSFQLIYVLVRVLSLDIYPLAVLISSFGVYIMATDLGYSGFVYFRTRQHFLKNGRPHGSEAEVFVLYLAVSVAAALVMGIAIALFEPIAVSLRLALACYFLSIVLALPWGLLRRIAAAVDLYLSFEAYEFIRRMFFVAVTQAMLAGLPFIAFTLICLSAWTVAFVFAIWLLRSRRGVVLTRSSPAAVLDHVKSNYRNIWKSGSLTLVEFAIYNFPYVAIPMLFADRTLIVAFDIFYKVVRFGAVAYAVPAESVLPMQTRAYYATDRLAVWRHYRSTIAIGLLPLAASLIVILVFGDRIFTALLSRGGIVDHPLRIAMAVMLVAVLFQNAAGTFLVGTGNYGRLSYLAFITLCLMAGVVLVTTTSGLSFSSFMSLYVATYCLHAVFYTVYLRRFLARMAIAPQPD